MAKFIFLCALLPAFALAETHPMLRHSGLPIPRFVTLKSSEINLRVGPGRDYPILWVYTRKGYPMEVISEFGHWRKLQDKEGTQGWVHAQLLSGERAAIMQTENAKQLIPIYADASSTSRLVMEAESGALLHLLSCQAQWCELRADEAHKGWAEKRYIWGVYKDDLFED
jgi:SH3-like domain-containing protein